MISIIIPVFKVEKFIARCLDSILCQTFQDFQIILVNDASPDDSIKIAESYKSNDSRIKILENKENSGAAWSRMVGYSNASSTYITFCDPDDYLPKNALEVLYAAMINDPAADICMGNYQRVFADGSSSTVFKNQLLYGFDKWSVAKSALKYEIPHFLVNKIYKRELFEYPIRTYKNFSKSSDEFLFFQLLQYCNKVINIDALVYYYYDNSESASYHKANVNALKAMIISQKYVERIYANKKGFESIIQQRKIAKYAKFIAVAGKNKELLQLVFKENIDHLFFLWKLLARFHKRKAIKVFLSYCRGRLWFFLRFQNVEA